MTHPAAVSIIMINRNGGAYVPRAVSTCRTAIEQALPIEPRIEFVVVDNGSTDGPEAAIERELQTAPFAWRIVHEPQAGVNYARNAGIENTSGDLLLFVDSDLDFDSGWLRAFLAAAAARPEAQIFAGRVRVGRVEAPVPEWLALDGPFVRTAIVVQCDYGDTIAELPLFGPSGPVGPNMGFRRSIFQQFGGVRYSIRITTRLVGTRCRNRVLRSAIARRDELSLRARRRGRSSTAPLADDSQILQDPHARHWPSHQPAENDSRPATETAVRSDALCFPAAPGRAGSMGLGKLDPGSSCAAFSCVVRHLDALRLSPRRLHDVAKREHRGMKSLRPTLPALD